MEEVYAVLWSIASADKFFHYYNSLLLYKKWKKLMLFLMSHN